MGPLWSDGDPDLKLLHESPRDQSWVTVDLRTDPLARLQLISGIGPGLAAKIVTARMEKRASGAFCPSLSLYIHADPRAS